MSLFLRAVYTYCENIFDENGNMKFHCRQYSPKTFDLQIAAMKLQTEVSNLFSQRIIRLNYDGILIISY